MQRNTRYQAAIIKNDHVLLLKASDRESDQTFWVIPGGGREANETEEACVQREVYEETHLHVAVVRLILNEKTQHENSPYKSHKTYLCRIISGEARPGIEPEIDDESYATIQEVKWFDLRDPKTWDALALNDPITYPKLQQLRSLFGYTS